MGGKRDETLGLRRRSFHLRRRVRSTLCEGPWGFALRPLRWPCLLGFMDLASEAVDDKAQVCVVCFRFHGTCHVELDKLPDLKNKSKQPKKACCVDVFEFPMEMPAWLFTFRSIRRKINHILRSIYSVELQQKIFKSGPNTT